MKLHLFEVDDWAILKNTENGEILYEGHGGDDLLQKLCGLLSVETTFLDDEETEKECMHTGTFYKAIKRWEEKHR